MGNNQRGNPFSNTYNGVWKDHPNLKCSKNFTLNPTQTPTQNPPHRKPSQLKEMLGQFM